MRGFSYLIWCRSVCRLPVLAPVICVDRVRPCRGPGESLKYKIAPRNGRRGRPGARYQICRIITELGCMEMLRAPGFLVAQEIAAEYRCPITDIIAADISDQYSLR